MENEAIYEAVVASASGPAGVVGSGGAKPGGPAEGGATEGSTLSEAGEAGGEGPTKKEEAGGFSVALARRALVRRRGELESLSEAELIVLRVDPQEAADMALGIVRRDSTPERRALFERFAEQGNYDIKHLDDMHDYAQVVWHTRRELALASHNASGAALPEEEVAAAYETRGRMMRVLDYMLGDRHDIQSLLDFLREGSGYLDLADDLHNLATTYQRDDVRPFVERDVKHYRASDVADAVRYAEKIRAARGPVEEGEVERLNGIGQRAMTLLLRSYAEHRRVGQFLFGQREDVAATYPSLVTAVRASRRKRGPVDEGGGEEPSGETPVDGA